MGKAVYIPEFDLIDNPALRALLEDLLRKANNTGLTKILRLRTVLRFSALLCKRRKVGNPESDAVMSAVFLFEQDEVTRAAVRKVVPPLVREILQHLEYPSPTIATKDSLASIALLAILAGTPLRSIGFEALAA